jgi:hypothetical protein
MTIGEGEVGSGGTGGLKPLLLLADADAYDSTVRRHRHIHTYTETHTYTEAHTQRQSAEMIMYLV